MVSIYGPKLTSRITYVLDYVFLHRLNTPYVYIPDYQSSTQVSTPSIEYSPTATLSNVVHIPQDHLLLDTEIHKISPSCRIENDIVKLFPVGDTHSAIDFDIFAAIFYMISRYEEYTYKSDDPLGRMKGKSSYAYVHSYADRPIVDEWIDLIKTSLTSKLGLTFDNIQAPYQVELTIDVDRAYAYANRPMLTNILGTTQNLLQGKLSTVQRRIATLTQSAKDPYDTYGMIMNRYNIPIKWFFLLANAKPYDTAIGLDDGTLGELITALSKKHTVGIHPSVSSHLDPSAITSECQILESYTYEQPTLSRQHYLNLHVPETYRSLIQAGIQHDYSMGYHDIIGFRAGTCFPFLWYDLRAEQTTDLTIHPFQIMDVTLKKYLGYSTTEAIEHCTSLIQNIKKVRGTCSLIWHNSSFYNEEGWQDWDQVLDYIVQSND